jgi:hypothetical protein
MKKLFIFFMLLSLMRLDASAQAFHPQPLAFALNPDGTLRSGVRGSFATEGYTMHFGRHGKPIFAQDSSKSLISPDTARADTARTDAARIFGTGGNGVNGLVRALVVVGNEVYVGGNFTEANVGSTPVPANNVACFNLQTNTWRALASSTGNGVNGQVYALAVIGDTLLYVGGTFTEANAGSAPVPVNNLACFRIRSNTWHALGTDEGNGVDGPVNALTVIGNTLYVGGDFTQANVGRSAVAANSIACFNLQTNTWRALASSTGNGVNGEVFAIAISGSDIYVGGEFTQANSGSQPIPANNVARFNTECNVWSSLSSNTGNGVQGQVFSLAVAGYDVYVGGEFTQANVGKSPLRVSCIARFNTGTNTWSKLGTTHSVEGTVYALAVSGSDIYAGGAFTRINAGKSPIAANYVARFNTSTNTWSTLGSGNGVDGTVNALCIVDSEIYLSGYFTHTDIFGTPILANRVARFNTSSKLWRSL